MPRILCIIMFLVISGCASQPSVTQLSVTYHSDPPGAVLYSSGQRIGYAPRTRYYNLSEDAKKRGFINLEDMKAQWASGASVEIKTLRADIKKYGFNQKFTFNRPEGVPGRENDMRFSLELERTKALKRQAAAQERQAAAQQRQAAAQEEQAAAESFRTYAPHPK